MSNLVHSIDSAQSAPREIGLRAAAPTLHLACNSSTTLHPTLPGLLRLRLLLLATLCIVLPSVYADAGHHFETDPGFRFRVERLPGNPIVHRGLPYLEGEGGRNINGPSLILAPDWFTERLGKYYLYFAHHHGRFIRLAYADELAGPWTVHPGGVLPLEQTPGYEGRGGDHVASPDVHLDPASRQVRMYFHQPNPSGGPRGQRGEFQSERFLFVQFPGVAGGYDGVQQSFLREVLEVWQLPGVVPKEFRKDGQHFFG